VLETVPVPLLGVPTAVTEVRTWGEVISILAVLKKGECPSAVPEWHH
jgi:hypothetical protein